MLTIIVKLHRRKMKLVLNLNSEWIFCDSLDFANGEFAVASYYLTQLEHQRSYEVIFVDLMASLQPQQRTHKMSY
jgi:hypothetical protein